MTADEYLSTEVFGTDFDDLERALQNFAKLKCQELLLLVAEKVKVKNTSCEEYGIPCTEDSKEVFQVDENFFTVDSNSILTCVDLDSFIEGTSSS